MLYYLDSKFFPQMRQRVDWLAKLESLLLTKTLQASDWNALGTLLECYEIGTCKISQTHMVGLLDTLSNRYPGSVQVLQYRYRYLSAIHAENLDRLQLLLQAQTIAPATPWIYSYILIEYAREQNVEKMYEYAQLWLLNDRQRFNLPLIKGMFIDPLTKAERSDD
jgi:hypothetical protein